MEVRKPTVYIETTVPNYVFNEKYPDEQEVAKLVFEAVDKEVVEGFVSVVVEDELEKAPTEVRPKLKALLALTMSSLGIFGTLSGNLQI